MTLEKFIIHTYCFVDGFLQRFFPDLLRRRGEKPALSDPELLTMEIVGEYLGYGSDKAIWSYFFPKIGCRTSFSEQSANLNEIKKELHHFVSGLLSEDQDLFIYRMAFLSPSVILSVTNDQKQNSDVTVLQDIVLLKMSIILGSKDICL